MKVYFAPMEGFTDAIYRRAHHQVFGGAEKYFIPFISPTQYDCLTPREKAAVLPEHNEGVPAVPQVLANRAEAFLWAARTLADLGYGEVNLNVGCPSGTVTAKYKGAGMLRDLDTLRAFLDEVFARSPLPVSVKTRIGFTEPEEWEVILALYRQYPIHELTIHPRTRAQYYKGKVWPEAFARAREALTVPLAYNGDVFSPEDAARIAQRCPGAAVMLGRGLLTDPALARQLHGGRGLSVDEVRRFHDVLYEGYLARYPKNIAVWRMCDAMKYLSLAFEEPHKCIKAMRKARSEAEYLDAVRRLLDEYPLRQEPYFSPEMQR